MAKIDKRIIIIALHKKHKGNWFAIYKDFMEHIFPTYDEYLVGYYNRNKYITIFDEEYPLQRMDKKSNPPFVIRRPHKKSEAK